MPNRRERPGSSRFPKTSSETVLRELNRQYIDAFRGADPEWYRRHLAPDFVCIESDGSIRNKAGFLRSASKGPDVDAYHLRRVHVRIYGSVALVQAVADFVRKDGTPGKSRYTDVYVRRGSQWKVVSAQVTRSPIPSRRVR